MTNQTFKGYRNLSELEIALINKIKETGEVLESLLLDLSESHDPDSTTKADPRWLAIGRTHLQEGLMALTRSIAKPESF